MHRPTFIFGVFILLAGMVAFLYTVESGTGIMMPWRSVSPYLLLAGVLFVLQGRFLFV